MAKFILGPGGSHGRWEEKGDGSKVHVIYAAGDEIEADPDNPGKSLEGRLLPIPAPAPTQAERAAAKKESKKK